MAILETSAECIVKIENKEIKYNVSNVRLGQFIDDHHELRVQIRQVGKASSKKDFDDPGTYSSFLGKPISLNIRPTGGLVDSSRELTFIGVVTEVSLDHSIDALNTVLIVAHSPTVSLDGAEQNAHYSDQSASDIIRKLLSKYPITMGKIESTSGKYKFDTQYCETDYEYIKRLAAGQSMFAYYDGKEFSLIKANSSRVNELVWRETLGSFRVGLGTGPHEFAAKVYNYEQKKVYSQDTKSLSMQSALSNMTKVSPDASKEIYKDSGYSNAPKVVEDAQSLDATLQTERNRSLGGMIKCSGQSNVPEISVGRCVKIKGMDKLDSLYWVKAVQHVFEESGKYHNTFVCSPLDMAFPERKPSAEILDDSGKPIMARKKLGGFLRGKEFTGLHTAQVTDNNDPMKLGRIKVRYSWIDAEVTKWIRLATPHAGKDRGWISLPEIGDEVLIGYEFGDPDYPIALGSLYNKDATPPADTGGDDNNIKVFMTRSGNQISMSDEDGSEKIQIILKDGGTQIVLDMSGPSLSIKSDGGDISIEGNNITIESQQEITLKAGTNLNIESGMNLKTKAGSMLDIEGTMVTVKGNPIQLN